MINKQKIQLPVTASIPTVVDASAFPFCKYSVNLVHNVYKREGSVIGAIAWSCIVVHWTS